MNVTVEAAERITDLQLAGTRMPLDDIALAMTVGRTVFDINDVMHLEAEFRNDSDARLTQVVVNCGLYNDGAVGGAFGYLSEITPMGLAGFDSTSGLANITPAPVDVRCHASPTISSEYQPGVAGSELQVQAGLAYHPGGVSGAHDVNIGATIHNPTQKAAIWVTLDVDMLDAQGRFIQVAVDRRGVRAAGRDGVHRCVPRARHRQRSPGFAAHASRRARAGRPRRTSRSRPTRHSTSPRTPSMSPARRPTSTWAC